MSRNEFEYIEGLGWVMLDMATQAKVKQPHWQNLCDEVNKVCKNLAQTKERLAEAGGLIAQMINASDNTEINLNGHYFSLSEIGRLEDACDKARGFLTND